MTPSRAERPIKVAVVGGGCAGLAAAFELTRPALHGKYAVTVYQMGWRLGGKGASGRGVSGRIEEHGLHLWMGYYENAFRLLRQCYAELGRDSAKIRIADWSDAFLPANFNAVMDWSPTGRWLSWHVNFPAAPGLPGDPDPPRWSIVDYLVRSVSLVRALLETLEVWRGDAPERHPFPELAADQFTAEALSDALKRLLTYGSLVGLGVAIEASRLLEATLRRIALFPQSLVTALLELITAGLRRQLDARVLASDEARRLWEVIDLLLAVVRGSIRFRLLFDPRGFDALDEYDSREWLRLNGASEGSINSAFIRSLYDLAFAYEQGDVNRPRIAAGSALRGALRAFFAYRGAFFWKLRAGMGDVVFAPLYEVLSRRGVRFEFFHKLRQVGLSEPRPGQSTHVETLLFDVQARVHGGEAYQPLVTVAGLPCWPARADYTQLVAGEQIEEQGWDLESQWDRRHMARKELRVGEDFDLVVLGVGLGVLPDICGQLIDRDERWRAMVQHVQSVPTQAFQLWLRRPMRELGWAAEPANVSGFVEPFDTWADMSHLASEENWQDPPRAIAYFCSVLPQSALPSYAAATLSAAGPVPEPEEQTTIRGGALVAREYERVRANAVSFLQHDIRHLWPRATSPVGGFCWDALASESLAGGAAAPADAARFDTQFWTANVRLGDRYSQALPGSTRYRISPLDRSYDNLTVAGDWTSCSLNMGCVEAAVMSGLLAAHAIAKSPALSEIIGYDHP